MTDGKPKSLRWLHLGRFPGPMGGHMLAYDLPGGIMFERHVQSGAEDAPAEAVALQFVPMTDQQKERFLLQCETDADRNMKKGT